MIIIPVKRYVKQGGKRLAGRAGGNGRGRGRP
jgi:hypothetical protein